MARWSGVLGVASLLLIVGCGSVAGGARVSTSPSSASAANLALTDTDAGKTFQLHVGKVVSAALHQPAGSNPWSGGHSPNPAVLAQPVETRSLAAPGAPLGSFR